MKHNGKNIITDQDITLTGNDYAGKTLDTVLTDQEERLDRIESNVKWIYKYGGVGSGSGGGSGSGSSNTWSAVVTRTDTGTILKDGVSLSLSGPGNYGFSVQIYRGGADTFSVQYSYQTSKGTTTASDNLNSNNSFNASRTLNLDTNGILTIKISNKSEPDEPPITYTIPYIVSSYSFKLYYVYADNKDPFTNHSNNTIFMNDVKGRGIMAALEYSVAVGIQSASYTYTDWEGHSETIDGSDEDGIKERTSKIIYIPLCSDINAYLSDNDNAKFRQFLLDIDLTLDGQTQKENIAQLSLKDTLIPSDLFLRVTASGGTIYDTPVETVDPANQFIVGTIVFQVTPFYGPIVLGRTYNFSVYLNDIKLGKREGIRITELSDQQIQAIPIPVSRARQYKITFVITEPSSQATYSIDYWFIAKEAISSFNYYPKRTDASGSSYIPLASCDVYRKLHEVENITGLAPETSISVTSVSDDPITYSFTSPDQTSYSTLDQMLCLGLQYVKTNDVTKPIARFNIKRGSNIENETGDIYIYQNKIVINKDARVADISNINGDSCEIYFPMCKKLSETNLEDYHLLTIYKRLEKVENGNNYWKGIYVFIDGDLEAAFGTYTTSHNKYTGITFFPGNYYVNLIENSCFSHTEDDEYHYYMDDIDVKGYYYAYKEIILGQPIDEVTKVLYDNFSTFKADDDNFILTNETTIHNIAENSEVPVIIMNFTDNGQGTNGVSGYKDCFKEFMSASYGENRIFTKTPVTISWSGGKSKPVLIQKDGSPAIFFVEPQGSSARGYRCKNWELYAPSPSDEGHICVYTPKFKGEDTTTFLPEESFTLKADIVDSSHTNNNAIASFVNDVTRPFLGATSSQVSPSGGPSRYSGYIKNCLSGFPILVFLHTNYKDKPEEVELNVNNYYFLGIYNFNLGRNSFFNLGYKNTGALEEVGLQDGFGIYELPEPGLLPEVMVGEVQGNNPYFDFSQYDTSILFKDQDHDNDETYMWGDLVGGGANNANTKTAITNFVTKVARAGGYIFDSLGKTYSDDSKHGYEDGYSVINQVPDYTWQAKRTLIGARPEYSFAEVAQRAGVNDLMSFLVTSEEAETVRGIDYNSLCEYYTICMAFGLVDSVEKNLNIKSWNAGREFYLAFYDMDTCLGVSNSGSKISYFAFSDYWDWKGSIEEGFLGDVKVYRDYAPSGESSGISSESFFDTPSSYLFAIAKYAYQVLKKTVTSESQISDLVYHPNNLWARWRKRGGINRGDGSLANAKTFIDKYYRHHLAGVPEVAFNYNYRYKYFVKTEDGHGFDPINFSKFYGRKIAYTETWLDNRLHILDAYFNINSIPEEMNGYSAPTVTLSNEVDPDNPDIYVFHDIFSDGSTGKQYANASAIINVKAKAYSPLICKIANDSSRFMFSDNENQGYNFLMKTNGNQYYLFGGSAMWTEVDSINPFIIYSTDPSFSITSDYFSKIVGTAGVCNSWAFNTPSLKYLSLTNQTETATYKGNIEFNGLENYPNLRDVRIDGTEINLKIANSNVVSISALGMKQGARLEVSNTPNIADIKVSGYLGDLSLPGWGTDIMIPGDGTTINSGKINIQNTKYPGATIHICNAPNLRELTLSGFRKVIVDNCPKLSNIILGDIEEDKLEDFGLRALDISYPVVYTNSGIVLSETLTIGGAGTAENTVDLSQWGEKFEALRLRHCPIKKVTVPDGCNINLLPYAFYDSQNFETLDGDSIFWICSSENYVDDPGNSTSANGAETFHNAIKFTMKRSNGETVKLHVHPYCTNLENTFCIDYQNLGGHGQIELREAQYFLNQGCYDPVDTETLVSGKVTNISYLFRGQGLRYGHELMISEYNQGKCSIGFGNFPKCNKFAYAYRDTWVKAYNRYMFAGMGRDATIEGFGYDFSQVILVTSEPSRESVTRGDRTVSDNVIYATTDFLQEIIGKIYQISFTNNDDSNNRLCFLDPSDGSILDVLKVRDIFCPSPEAIPERLRLIKNTEFFRGHVLDMEDAFNWGNNGTLTLERFMYTVDYLFFVDGSLDRLFYNTNLYSASYSFRNLYGYQGEVDVAQFIDWTKIGSVYNFFAVDTGIYSLGFNKKVAYRDFQNIVWYNILKNPPRVCKEGKLGIGSIFQDCTVYFDSGQEYEDFSLVAPGREGEATICHDIVNISFLFSSMKAKVVGAVSYSPLKMTSNFLKYLPDIKVAREAFRNTYWANSIPWDFFNKRSDIGTRNVYVKDSEDNFIPATLTGEMYRQELTDINNCFANITLPGNYAWMASGDYNKEITTWTIEGSDGNLYDSYYDTPDGEEVIDWAYRDSTEAIEAAIPPGEGWIPSDIGSIEWTNPLISGSGVGMFVSPDVFCACAVGCNVSGCFTASNSGFVMTGVIPRHLVWPLGKASDLGNIMSNLNILPRFYDSRVSSDGTIENYYYFVPSGYTQRTSLVNAFNFKMLLPKENYKVGGVLNKDYYFIFLNDSLPKDVASLNNSLPVSSVIINQMWSWKGTFDSETGERDDGVYYTLMGTPEYDDNDQFLGMSTGISLHYYDSLRLDGFIQPSIAAIVSGRIFAEDLTDWVARAYLSNTSNSAIYLSSSGLSYAAELYLPPNNNQFMSASSQCYVLCDLGNPNRRSITNPDMQDIDRPTGKLNKYPFVSIIS